MIVRFRKRPIEIDTVLWTGDNLTEVQAFVGLKPGTSLPGFLVDLHGNAHVWNDQEKCYVQTPVLHRVARGALDEYYPISPAALDATFDEVGPVGVAP